MTWTGIVAESFDIPAFREYVEDLSWNEGWKPSFITLHNTAAPSLAQRPNGFTRQHMFNLEKYYRDQKGWPSGPHLFIDDHKIWVFNPLTKPGTHSPSWNRTAIGIEMLGDYATESFVKGRGADVRVNSVHALGFLSLKLGFKHDAWRFHKQDPKTTHDCPGINVRNVRKALEQEVAAVMGAKPVVAYTPSGEPFWPLAKKKV